MEAGEAGLLLQNCMFYFEYFGIWGNWSAFSGPNKTKKRVYA